MTIYYDTANNHRLEPIERRADGYYLYRDLEDGSRIVCRPDSVSLYPQVAPARQMDAVMRLIGSIGKITHVRACSGPATETWQ